ncbi:MAG: sugar phosphate isomerase/epimerase [Pirellulales bacterium]|nr:sugar phosphate isomerase/epimerase [Pirellulales bacterium]
MAMTRRHLLTGTAGAATATLADAPARAIEPVKRSGSVPLRLSLAAYSLRQHLESKPGSPQRLDLIRFADLAAEWGFDVIEPTAYYVPVEVLDGFARRQKRYCFLLGLDVSGGAIASNFTLAPGPKLGRENAHVERWVDLYAELDAPVIRVFTGQPGPGMSEAEAVDNAVRNLQQACDAAGRRGVILAIESHGFLMQPERIQKIVRRVDTPWFGVNWDSGEFFPRPIPTATSSGSHRLRSTRRLRCGSRTPPES